MKTRDLVLTDSIVHPPCCLPGFSKDTMNKAEPCHDSSPCQCDTAICSADEFSPAQGAKIFLRQHPTQDQIDFDYLKVIETGPSTELPSTQSPLRRHAASKTFPSGHC
jgi:hypothetical protein